MIKGITLVHAVAAEPAAQGALDQLAELLHAIGFEAGRGWQDDSGRGVSLLAPLGNLELVAGRLPAVPPVLIETTQLDHIHTAIRNWLAARFDEAGVANRLSAPELTQWNSRLFTVALDAQLTVGFWQSEDPLHNRPVALEGDLSAVGMRFAVITTRWNTVITDRLLQGALDALLRSGAARADIQILRVPGAWEIPSAARAVASSGKVDAVVTLGCLLRGETAHYEAIYNEVARGIGQSQQETGVPHAFGVLTCETLEQALDRAGLKAGNKGFEAAIAAIEMVSIHRKLGRQGEA
ncbi:MAG: 6,7-dimethyl-8-ribityllumazine synthase [Acidobacteriota bacterium]|nr:6,7-dimethyl-8-ribityllumazine synthase [Acidobacteriota bacterium]